MWHCISGHVVRDVAKYLSVFTLRTQHSVKDSLQQQVIWGWRPYDHLQHWILPIPQYTTKSLNPCMFSNTTVKLRISHGSSHVYTLHHFISFSIGLDKSWMLVSHSTWYFCSPPPTTGPLISGMKNLMPISFEICGSLWQKFSNI